MLAARSASSPRRPRTLLAALATRWTRLVRGLRAPYRPERHYMRGPGPKWRASQTLQRTTRAS